MEEKLSSLPKEFWLPNESSKACRKCLKHFSAILRRHHCRYCGLIFCDKCAKLNQKIKYHTKLSRICDNCLNLVKSSPEELTLNPSVITSSFMSSLDSENDYSDEIDENILDLVQELLPNNQQEIELSTNEFIIQRCKTLLSQYDLPETYAKILIPSMNEVIETVCPSVKVRKDDMNINKYVKIMQIPSDYFKCEFFQGTSLLKNIANKKMPKIVDRPRILFLEKEDEEEEVFTTMSNLINEETQMTKLFVKKIVSISPNIVVSLSTLSEKVIKKLMKKEIVAIINLDEKDYYHLARITKGYPLRSINQGCMIEKVLGKCRKMEVQVINDQSYIYFNEISDFTLGGCLLVHSNYGKKVKKVIRQLLIDYRNAKLERIFLLECGVKWSEQLLLELFFNETSLKYLSVCAHNICIRETPISLKLYSEKDICIGKFLINLTNDSENPCSKCGNFNKDHIHYYIKGEIVVKLSMFKVKMLKENEVFLSTNCRECHKSVSLHYLSNATWEYSFYKFISNFFCSTSGFAKCGHPIFRNSFKFQIGTLQVLFEYEDYKKFEFSLSQSLSIKNDFHNSLIAEYLNDTQISSKCVLDNILNQGKGIVIKINHEMAVVDSTYDQWLEQRQILLNAIEKIYETMREIFEPDASLFSSCFQVEAMRRTLFLECCNFKLLFVRVEAAMKKIKPRKGGSVLIPGAVNFTDPTYVDPDFLMDEDLLFYFYKLQAGNLTLPMGNSCFVPVYESDIGSFIAHTLCSNQYFQEIIQKSEQNIETVLLGSEASEFSLHVTSYENMDVKHSETMRKLYGDYFQFSVTCAFPAQFHSLRTALKLPHINFAVSLSKTIYKADDLGKSGAIFKKTHDHMYIIKVIDEREYRMFLGLAPNYFKHMCKGIFHNMPTMINFCLGAFKINMKNQSSGKSKTEWCLVFENIGNGLKGLTISYDLKGTTNKRRRVKDGDKKTKMDVNFVEDFSCLPLPLSFEHKRLLEAAIINDSLFLSKQNVIDYSVLLVISMNNMKICMGIIDYMQQYTLDKVIESKYKSAVGTQVPTITHPDQYKARFRDQVLNCYFFAVDE